MSYSVDNLKDVRDIIININTRHDKINDHIVLHYNCIDEKYVMESPGSGSSFKIIDKNTADIFLRNIINVYLSI